METKKYKITMGNPCKFGWQNMTPTENGRHCDQCNKTVVDFTIMTDEQVINYLIQHKNICGHFNKSQLGRTMVLNVRKPQKKMHWPAIAAMLVAGMFQITTLQAQNKTPIKNFTGRDIEVNDETKSTKDNSRVIIDNDTLVTIKIKVVDAQTKKIISGASIEIPGIGSYKSDKLGYFKISFCTKKLPNTVKINAWANFYYYYEAEIEITDFIKSPVFNIEMWFNDPNIQVDGGDIDITPIEDK